jgi:Raf kinase inhibitor-like YbhB/YbcL family protein
MQSSKTREETMKAQLTVAALIAGLAAQTGLAFAADPFTITSSAYKDGDVWPAKFAGSDPSRTNPPCPGQNVSPPLAWSNAPEATKSFAIVMYDPDGGNGTGAVHWVAYDIPKSKTSLAEGEASVSPKDWLGGKNNVGTDHYFGPCGPSGHALHHYIITVMATSVEPGTLKAGMTRDELLAALRGKSLAPASIVGRYTRP